MSRLGAVAVRRVTLAIAGTLAAAAMSAPAGARAQVSYAFENVTVIPMDSEGLRPGQTVVVVEGRITAVGPAGSVAIPEGAERIAGAGRFLMPGLAEMHAHVPPTESGWPDREELSDILFLYVANGVTTIRGMLGAPYQIELRDALARGEILGPTLYAAGPSLRDHTPAEAEALVRANAAAGYDLQKIHPGASRATWDRMVRVAREVGLTFGGHVPAAVGVEHALASGISTIDHLDGYVEAVASAGVRARLARGENVPLREVVASATPERIREIARLTVAAGTWQVPTLYLWENLRGAPDVDALMASPELRYIPHQQREQYRNAVIRSSRPTPEVSAAHNQLRLDILKEIHDAGGRILMGTDSPQLFNVPGFSLHREIERMEAAALSCWAVLRSGTREVARYVAEALGQEGNFGAVVVGSRADLLLLEANPLDDFGNVQRRAGVMVNGRWLSAAQIEEGLERLATKHGAQR